MLFDDIEPELCLADKSEFSSSAEAQAFLTNKIFDWFSDLNVLLFCPTGMVCTGYLKRIHTFKILFEIFIKFFVENVNL